MQLQMSDHALKQSRTQPALMTHHITIGGTVYRFEIYQLTTYTPQGDYRVRVEAEYGREKPNHTTRVEEVSLALEQAFIAGMKHEVAHD